MTNNRICRGLWRVSVALLCLAAVLLSVACRGSDVPLSPGLSVIEGEPVYDKDVAMRTDRFTVTPGMMAYFFYTYGATVLSGMEQTVPYDESKRLHDQMYTDTLSFYDVIMNETLDKVSRMLIYCEAGAAAGLTLTAEAQKAVEDTLTSYRMQAAIHYDMEIGAYLNALYGPLMTEADLRAVLELESFASSYSLTVESELEQGITEERIRAYAAEQGLTDATPSRNIAYLFVPFTEGAANEAVILQAMNALQASPSEQTLLGLAALGTTGTEKDLTPNNSGIKALEDWLFADGRRVGDYGRVDLDGATYILLYTGNGMSFGEASARMALFDAAYADWYNGWVARLHFGYNYDCLDGYDAK